MTTVLIVDDEPLARKLLREMLAAHADVSIAGEAATGAEAVDRVRALKPDLVFLDVQMPELDGFGVLEQLGDDLPGIVFVTAYDEYAVRAFDAEALDYLLKPFDAERLDRALGRARERLGGRDSAATLRAVRSLAQRGPAAGRRARVPIHVEGVVRFLDPATIDWVEADGKLVRIHQGKQHVATRQSLSDIESTLGPDFVRVHRSAIVNVAAIAEIQPWFHGDHVIILRNGAKVKTGRAYREPVKRLMTTGR